MPAQQNQPRASGMRTHSGKMMTCPEQVRDAAVAVRGITKSSIPGTCNRGVQS